MSVYKAIYDKLIKLSKIRAQHGPYRYLVRNWSGSGDANLAADILGTDFYRSELSPLPAPIQNFKRFVVIAPHQDDETIGTGGLMIKAHAAGAKIDIINMTDGAPRASLKYAATAEEAMAIRDAESHEVARQVGAVVHHIGISNTALKVEESHIAKLKDLIAELKPEVILTPWILDQPAVHRLCNVALGVALKRLPKISAEIWGYQVHNNLLPNLYLDITDVMEKKIELIKIFKSQNHFSQRYDHIARGMAIWNGRLLPSTEEKYYEVYTTLPAPEFIGLMQKFYTKAPFQTFTGYKNALQGALPWLKVLNEA